MTIDPGAVRAAKYGFLAFAATVVGAGFVRFLPIDDKQQESLVRLLLWPITFITSLLGSTIGLFDSADRPEPTSHYLSPPEAYGVLLVGCVLAVAAYSGVFFFFARWRGRQSMDGADGSRKRAEDGSSRG